MPPLLKSITLTISIDQKPKKVYDFVSSLANLSTWAPSFCKAIKKINGRWVVTTMQGPVGIKITPRNSYGIVDHVVIPAPGIEIEVPMRIIPNGKSGTEVLFTLFHRPGMTPAQFREDQRLVRADLKTLKKVMGAKV